MSALKKPQGAGLLRARTMPWHDDIVTGGFTVEGLNATTEGEADFSTIAAVIVG